MKIHYLLFLFLVSFHAFSQKEGKNHVVDLLDFKDEEVLHASFYIDNVVDNRIYKENIGFAQKGPFNKDVPAVFPDSLSVTLQNYFNRRLPNKNDSLSAITIRINQLLVSEKTGFASETGTAIINMDFLKKKSGNTYYLLDSYVKSITKNAVMDATSKHDDRLRELLNDGLNQFNKNIATLSKETNVISIENKTIISPLIEGVPPKEGFYPSFSELYRNQSILDSGLKEKKRKDDKLYFESDNKKEPSFYAYSNGSDIYLNATIYSEDKHYIKTKRVDDFLLFNDTFVNENSVAALSFTFGLMGALIGNQNNNVLLDLSTGKYYLLSGSKMKALLNGLNKNLFKLYKKNDRNTEEIAKLLEYVFENTPDKEKAKAIIRS
ncbi:hypothetical protein [Galbibacter sp. PAP.153]|uniref:hypothetical protein n=1 Tax=Galbibacter sp. PAP.153 TaxID=3104623 RepID=UPI00300B700F